VEPFIFINGITLGALVAIAVVTYRLHAELKDKRELLNESMSQMLKTIVESHNTLNTTIATMDKKLTETSLRVDGLAMKKTTPFMRTPHV